jgi:hypothetical protein
MTSSEKGNWKIDFNKEVKYPYAYMKDGKMDMESYNNDLALSIDVELTLWDNNIERLFY